MGPPSRLALLLLTLLVLALIGQAFGLYEVPLLRLVLARMPETLIARTPEPAQPPIVVSPKPAAASSPSPTTDAGCTITTLRFVHGAAALRAALGEVMGTPVECERVVDAQGNTEQRTTSGLAYYRVRTNEAVFTNGVDHWALTPNGLVHWTTDEVEPPPGAEAVR